jgi:hypothetical protein
MRSLCILVAVATLIKSPCGSAGEENPLEGTLVDPWGIVTRTPPEPDIARSLLFDEPEGADWDFGSGWSFQPHHADQISHPGSFQQAVSGWKNFRLAPLPVQEGAIFFGDPRLLLGFVPEADAAPSQIFENSQRSVDLTALLCGFLVVCLGYFYLRKRKLFNSR